MSALEHEAHGEHVLEVSGLRAGDGRGYSEGMQMYFRHVNRAGGIHGNTLMLVRQDDAGHAERTLVATQQLLQEQRPLLLAGYMGSGNLARLQQSGVLEREKIALVGYRGGSFLPGAPQFYNVRADLRDELAKMAEHLATVGLTQLGLLLEDGPDAAEVQASVEDALRRYGSTLVAKASYQKDTLRMESAARRLLASRPQAIVLATSGAAAAAFIEKYRAEGGTARLFACSDVDLEQMAKRLGEETMQGVAIAQVAPSPYRAATRLGKEFREVRAREGDPAVPASYAMMEGYIAAKVIAEAVRRAGSRPTRESVAAALDGIDSLDLGGHTVGYRAGQRTGARFVELSIISASGRIRQ